MACVFFDWDGTLVTIEGIDELARMAGCYEQVAALTSSAMSGDVSLREVYAQRMELVRPSAAMLDELGDIYSANASCGAAEAVATLLRAGHNVIVVSAGCKQAILPLATRFNITAEQVYAVGVFTDEDGTYQGFEGDNPLLQADGKGVVCRSLCADNELGVMVGDGHNDVSVTDYGLHFVQYTGVVDRVDLRRYASKVISTSSMASLPKLVDELTTGG